MQKFTQQKLIPSTMILNNQFFHSVMHLIREAIKFEQPSDKLLSNFFNEHRSFTSAQRTIVADSLYGIIRHYYQLNKLVGNHVPDTLGLTWIKLLKLPRSCYTDIKLIDYPRLSQLDFHTDDLLQLELPQWLIDQLCLHFTMKEVQQLAHSLQQKSWLDVRINSLKTNLNTVLNELKEYQPQKMLYSPLGIRFADKAFISRHPLFLDGSIEIQDESSQLSGLLLAPKRGDMVVDFCAGAGGKTLLLGMLMRNSGRIHALDINQRRLNNLSIRVKRSGLTNVNTILISNEYDTRLQQFTNKMDKVFVDVPCSGTGTLRRNPDVKFRQNPTTLERLNVTQFSILQQASQLVKSGGYLVYATCSILYCENQAIIEKFLLENKNFHIVPANTILKNSQLSYHNDYLILLPHIHQCDGFFAALLQKS